MKPDILLSIARRGYAYGAAAMLCLLTQTASADLTHRYSFETDATDSIAGANGTPKNTVAFSSGTAVFSGQGASGPACDYIELPPGLISNYTTVTVEFWVDVGGNGIWPEVFAFGRQTGTAGANMLMFCPHSGSAPNDYRMSYAQGAPGYTDEYVVNGVGVLDGLGPVSVTCVFDPPNNSMALYTNGGLVALRSPVTDRFSLTNIHNVYSWLGRSLYNGDASFAGSLDEFRIYNTALGGLQIAVNAQAGPNSIVTNIDVSAIAWGVNTNMIVGEQQDTTVTFNTVNYGNITVSGSTEATYSSSDPNTISVDTHGRLVALAIGSATVSASYGTTTNSVQVTVGSPVIAHRYSFTGDGSDSVGEAHGILVGSASIASGAVVLSGAGTSATPDAYVDLPNDLLTNFSTATIEMWFTDTGSGTWARLWDLGNSNLGEDLSETGTRFMYLTLPNGGGALQGTIHLNDRAGGDFGIVAPRPPVNQPAHAVWITSVAAQMAWLYVNGTLVGQATGVTLKPSDLGPTVNNWLGRSQWGGDAMFKGTIDEFRIWSGAMNPLQVAIDAASGPNNLITNAGALQTITLTVDPDMVPTGRQSSSVVADFANIADVTITSAGATFTSGNTNILTVNANGQIIAVGLGSTTITASYGGQSDTKTITVAVPSVVLAHRYNFNETSGTTAEDLVGTADGTLQGGAAFASGAVVTDGIGGYVDLPANVIQGFDAVTIETWVTVDPNTLNDSNGRLFMFGSVDGVNELGLTARTTGQNTFLRLFGPSTVTALRGGTLAQGGQYHLVGIFNAPVGTIDFYLNGVWQNSATNFNFSIAQITNTISRLGANIALTSSGFTAASFNDLRIYNGALDLASIRTSLAAGPDIVVTNLGTPTSITLSVDSSMYQGSKQTPHVRVSSAAVSNVDLTGTGVAVFTSSDQNVITVTSDGRLQSVGAGTANITATIGGQTDTKPVTVFPKQPMLTHRYSFTNDVSDTVGAQNGSLWGNAFIQDGAAVLDGEKSSYVELPSYLVSSFDAVTFEAWVSLNSVLGDWCRIYDIGSQDSGALGVSYFFLTPHVGGGASSRVVLDDGPSEAGLDFGSALDGFVGAVAVVYNSVNDTMTVYTNGLLALSTGLGGKSPTGVNDVHTWLGRSLYNGDAGLSGIIDEFRIYAGGLTAAQISASYAAGPNQVALPPPVGGGGGGGPKLTASSDGTNLTITWPGSETGFSVQTTGSLGPGAPTWGTASGTPQMVNGQWQLQVPIGAQPAFFRLIK